MMPMRMVISLPRSATYFSRRTHASAFRMQPIVTYLNIDGEFYMIESPLMVEVCNMRVVPRTARASVAIGHGRPVGLGELQLLRLLRCADSLPVGHGSTITPTERSATERNGP